MGFGAIAESDRLTPPKGRSRGTTRCGQGKTPVSKKKGRSGQDISKKKGKRLKEKNPAPERFRKEVR